jgi:hypothetical protein
MLSMHSNEIKKRSESAGKKQLETAKKSKNNTSTMFSATKTRQNLRMQNLKTKSAIILAIINQQIISANSIKKLLEEDEHV